jgi:hypothetical protein
MEYQKIIYELVRDIFNSKVFVSLAGVVIGFLLSACKDRRIIYQEKRNKSLLGVAVIEYLLEEVDNGYKLLVMAKQNGALQHFLPSKTWGGNLTINDDILLRIIAVSHGVSPRGFPPREIRTHCKNYFENIVGQFNRAIDARQPLGHFFDGSGSKFDEATKGVLDMLQQTKELLEQDAASRKPKI